MYRHLNLADATLLYLHNLESIVLIIYLLVHTWEIAFDFQEQTSQRISMKIANWGKNAYFCTDGKTSFYFGVTDDKQFFSGSDQLMAQYAVKPSNHPIDAKIQKLIVGQKLAMVINLAKSSDSDGSGKDDAISTVTGLLTPVFGNLTSVVYTLKVKD